MSRTNWRDLQARGYETFNEWRAEHPRARPNFAEMAFHKQTSFARYDLHGADLHAGRFKQASFRNANLQGADLSGAYLGYADFARSDLRGANLRGSDLRDAFLSGARLENADLSGALLQNANLTGSTMGDTGLANVDLSTITGLIRVKHVADSSIDIATIYRSNGRIPKAFMRGAGVPKRTISHVREISAQRGLVRSAFISHASQDKKQSSCFCMIYRKPEYAVSMRRTIFRPARRFQKGSAARFARPNRFCCYCRRIR